MVVRKILEATLVAGSTSVTFTDTDIPNSLLRVYCSRSALFPISQTLSGNSVTVNYKPQDSNIGVALEIVKSGLDIVDDLTTEDNTKALSANQGYVLKGLIDNIVIPTVPENITDLDDVSVTDIANGQVLAWNSTTEKFENVNQSGGSSITYNNDEQLIGTYFGNNLYKKTITVPSTSITSTETVIPHGIANINKICLIEGIAFKTGNGFTPLTTYHSSSAWACGVFNLNRTNFTFFVGGSLKPFITELNVTFYYTKTS